MVQRQSTTHGWCLLLPVVCFLNSAFPTHAAPRVTWHHSRSPYRAELQVQTKPNHRKAGIAVSVPVCGTGKPDGSDFFAYDERGTQLSVLPLGQSVHNSAIALVAPPPVGKRVFVYFGSGINAPQHKGKFLASLTLDIRTLPKGPNGNLKQIQALLPNSKRIARVFTNTVQLACNPADASDACILIFEGYLNVPIVGHQTLMLVSDDAGYVFVNDALLLARDGRHWARDAVRGECRKAVPLKAGANAFKCVVVDFGGTLMAVVARWISGKNKHVLKPGDFVQPGKTKLTLVDSRHQDQTTPLFWYRHLSYASYLNTHYTEVELGTYTKEKATWNFEDGDQLQGGAVRKIFVGLGNCKLQVSQGRAKAAGVVTFPETPPKQVRLADTKAFMSYSASMLSQNIKGLSCRTLLGCIDFLQHRELNEDVIPFCEAALDGKLAAKTRRKVLEVMARSAAKNFPGKAGKAYELLLREDLSKSDWEKRAQEYAEFIVFRQRDFERAEKLLRHMQRELPGSSKTPVVLQLDLALQQGREEQAKQYMEDLLSGRELGKQARYAAVKSNALRQRVADLVKGGFVVDARAKLSEWQALAPNDRLNGSLSLARARMWRRLGWLDGALGELDGAILLDPLLPNLPDVELERARICQEAGDNRKANEILLRIVKEFPNHPAAKSAKELVR
ncbi:MAG: hypothetical protein HN742_05100 [Lentisphaerae bacterium]|jgi:hypothetical protein|nr:hypothetical protein [Lentisphaerota bacterium]MBT4823044.1 hypothetical protein [Lentisphaerota bacterium]MBT5610805.1 hypothetical protein [Lentisphaerota bacterium]MBT7053763.1 hypothetical protein [Lentisphaerota bacterium]MBT7841224.1 hypothetical protein [Lentisphaerota bacterium]